MKVGSLVYATDQGLGILARDFYHNGVVTDVIVIRHGRHETHDDWYPGVRQIAHLRDPIQLTWMKDFCASMDVMLFFETPFVWELIRHCRQVGTKTALMVMYECLHQNVWGHQPDLLLCPSLLDQRAVLDLDCPAEFIPVPVSVPWRKRERAEVFVHNAGWGGLKGRNGTAELLEAWPMIKSPAKLLLRSQAQLNFGAVGDNRIELRVGTFPQSKLWDEGDVFVFPEKFNGLSLPLQEARAAGMLVMCGNRFPMNEWLPRVVDTTTAENKIYRTYSCPLIPVKGCHKERIGPPYLEYDCAEFDPRTIADKIDEWYGKDISAYSESGRAWAKLNSWTAIKQKYVKVLEDLIQGG